ncbi:MAG: polysaccharide deacetylase family protein [Acidobacteriota bacterium]
MSASSPDRGALVVSLDLELLWGYHDVGINDVLRGQCDGARVAIRRLLDLFTEYRVPATWAIVGHLYLDRAERDSQGKAHPHHPRPVYPWVPGDWFDRLPAGDAASCPDWYGRDLVEMIQQAGHPQEIGCHTFSHVIFGDPGCTPEVARAELQQCVTLAHALGIDLKTMVFPRNKVGHLGLVREAGIEVYRGRDVAPFGWLPTSLRDQGTVLSRVLSVPPPPVLPSRTPEGLVNLPGSMFYMAATEWQRFVPMAFRTLVAKRGLRDAARQKAIFHLRLHPEALVFGADRLFAGLADIFDEAERLRRAGHLQMLSVYDAAMQYLRPASDRPQ